MLLVLVLSWLVQAQVAPSPTTPLDCIKAGRDFSTKRLKELGPTTSDTVRQVTTERVAMLRECAAQFDISRTAAADLAPLVDLYAEAQQMDLAQNALTCGLADRSLDVPAKGNLLMLRGADDAAPAEIGGAERRSRAVRGAARCAWRYGAAAAAHRPQRAEQLLPRR